MLAPERLRAEIAQGEIDWQGEMNRVASVPLGEKLCFKTVVTNIGTVPIRTTGPWPGQEYKFGENYNTLAGAGHPEWFQQAGVWRFGINFDTTGIDFPYRWAIGRPEDLEKRVIDGTASSAKAAEMAERVPILAAAAWSFAMKAGA